MTQKERRRRATVAKSYRLPLWVVEINFGNAERWQPTVGVKLTRKEAQSELDRLSERMHGESRLRVRAYRRSER